ncbi:MAG: single-stranded DNA-binding protein [Clostridiaceae bacterium]|nr:single-stranded DNA-binding protein [Clostridiaceae bacterium]
MNQVTLIGRLTRDVELRYTTTGKAVGTFTLAVNKRGKDEADFFKIILWDKTAENCSNYIGKGRLVAVSGRLQTRNYIDDLGIKRWITEVVAQDVQFLDRGNDSTKEMLSNFSEVQEDDELPF